MATDAIPLHQPPFCAPDAERAVLGCCMTDAGALTTALAAGITARDFAATADHGTVWLAMEAMRAKGEPIDAVAVAGVAPALDIGWLVGLMVGTGSVRSVAWHVESLMAATARRAVWTHLFQSAQRLRSQNVTPDEVRSEAVARLASVPVRGRKTEWTQAELSTRLLDRLAAPRDVATGKPIGTGLTALDQALDGGWRPQELVLVGGRPGMGKSVFCGQVALHASRTMPVGFLALEMSADEMQGRNVAGEAGVDSGKLLACDLTHDELARVTTAAAGLADGANLLIDDGAGRRIEDIIAIARAWHATYGIRLLVVDHLGKIRLPRADRHDLAVGAVGEALKNLAKTLDITVIAAVQLNRDAEGQRPTIANLRDSGTLEAEANTVIFPWREEPHARTATAPAELIIGKRRSGRTGMVPAVWDGPGQRFRDAEVGGYGRPADAPLPGGTRRQANGNAKATRQDWRAGMDS